MRPGFLLLLQLLFVNIIRAQLIITPGAQFSVAGNMQLTLQNTDLVNNGVFTPGNNMVSFTGNISSSISGSGTVRFFQLEVNKTENKSVILQRQINIVDRALFTSGFLELNQRNADLETTGHLDGEREDSRITGPTGGEVLFRTQLNAPTGANPANLGVVITSSQNLGDVIIRRGHVSQVGGSLAISILRYYDITPSNNTNVNAILRINYFDGELNGLSENSLAFFKSDDLIDWSALGFTSRDAVNNFVENTGIASFSRFTLSNTGNPLPVLFVAFGAKCDGNKIVINWKTAQEQNSSRFDIEKSPDAIHWTVISNLPAAGNSSTEKSYSFNDNDPVQNDYYRIAEYGLDGKVQYTGLLRSSCNAADYFTLWPNPVHNDLHINIVSTDKSLATISVFDSKGALVKLQSETVLQGSNQYKINMAWLPKGSYVLAATWNNGQMKKTVQVIKQ